MRRWLVLLFLAVAVVAVVAMAPLSAVLSWAGAERLGLSAREASGTVWRGTLRDARYGPVRLGDVAVTLDPLALVAGRLRMRSRSEAGAYVGGATWIVEGRDVGLEAVDGELSPSFLRSPVPLPGRAQLQAVGARFREGRCVQAQGRLTAGPMSGALGCADGALAAPLQGRTPFGDTRLNLLLRSDGGYSVETRITGADPTTAASLRLAGFVDAGGVLIRKEEGRLAVR